MYAARTRQVWSFTNRRSVEVLRQERCPTLEPKTPKNSYICRDVQQEERLTRATLRRVSTGHKDLRLVSSQAQTRSEHLTLSLLRRMVSFPDAPGMKDSSNRVRNAPCMAVKAPNRGQIQSRTEVWLAESEACKRGHLIGRVRRRRPGTCKMQRVARSNSTEHLGMALVSHSSCTTVKTQ